MANDNARLMITAPASGGGKTTLTIGLLRAFRQRGLSPAAFKCGPDYIDPMFHREVLGVPGRNLDLFFTGPETVRGLLRAGSAHADISILEGVMGHYDGVGGTETAGSRHLASETGTPAVLLLQPKGAFLSLAALVHGFLRFREESMLRGIVLNRCGGGLYSRLRPMLERETGLRVYGYLPDMPETVLQSRHLGLATPENVDRLAEKIDLLAERMATTVDLDGLLELAAEAPPLTVSLPTFEPRRGRSIRIAVARDAAFCFYYQENLDLLRALGAELAFFSPLRDTSLPGGAAGLYLGGGYPEVHARELANNLPMRRTIKAAAADGMPVLAECGGFLYLQEELVDSAGNSHAMVGHLPGLSGNAGRLQRFGYVTLRAEKDTLLCAKGERVPAHEFHYWDSDVCGDAFTAEKAGRDDRWSCISATENVFAGFPHLYFWSNPAMAERFVDACGRYDGVD